MPINPKKLVVGDAELQKKIAVPVVLETTGCAGVPKSRTLAMVTAMVFFIGSFLTVNQSSAARQSLLSSVSIAQTQMEQVVLNYAQGVSEFETVPDAINNETISTSSSRQADTRQVEDSQWSPSWIPDQSTSLINDKTLEWNPDVDRLWLSRSKNKMKPRVQILLTNIGWNQPDQTEAIRSQPRSLRETSLMEGVINHPWFHPTAWVDLNAGTTSIDPEVYYYVFFDKFQCLDHHWPVYGAPQEKGFDDRHGRTIKGETSCWRLHECKTLPILFNASRLFREAPHVRMVYIDCLSWGHKNTQTNITRTYPLSLVVTEAITERVNVDKDQGLPPPAIVPVTLNATQVADIESCQAETNREWYLTYWGNFRSGLNSHFRARAGLRQFHNETKKILIMNHIQRADHPVFANASYTDMLSQTVFAVAARGDNKYSYRFTEVLSAGTIPVYMGDNWIMPFQAELVKWEECAVILPEREVDHVLSRLKEISLEERCERRKKCYSIYKNYMETPAGTINGIVEGLQLVADRDAQGLPRVPLSGYHCEPNPDDPKYCNIS